MIKNKSFPIIYLCIYNRIRIYVFDKFLILIYSRYLHSYISILQNILIRIPIKGLWLHLLSRSHLKFVELASNENTTSICRRIYLFYLQMA